MKRIWTPRISRVIFYMYCNGTWYKNTTVGNTIHSYAGTFYDTSIKIHSDTKKAFAADANGKLFLADLDNMDKTAGAALKSIAAHIHEFDGISTRAEAWAAIGKAKKMGYNPLIDLMTYMKSGTVRLLYTWPTQEKLTEDVSATSSYLKALGYSEEEATAIASSAKAAKDELTSAYNYTNYTLDNLEYVPTLNSNLYLSEFEHSFRKLLLRPLSQCNAHFPYLYSASLPRPFVFGCLQLCRLHTYRS